MFKRGTELKTVSETYTIIESVGTGGNATVFRAKDSDSNDSYAIKCIEKTGTRKTKFKRFMNELNALSKIEHSNIVKVLDYGLKELGAKDYSFYVMPYYEKTLRRLIDDGINGNKIISIFEQLLEGLKCVHTKGIFHRDIKPENVLYDDRKSIAILADFGCAHFSEEYLLTAVETTKDDRLANFQYCSPEQRKRGGYVDYRSDIYAIGLILNEMFTGTVPAGTNYRRIEDVNPKYKYLDQLVLMMLEQNPDNRPESVSKIQILLKAYVEKANNQETLQVLKSTKIDETEITDSIVLNPPKLIDAKWENGLLTLFLSEGVNDDWVNIIRTNSRYSVMGKGIETWKINKNTATIDTSDDIIDRLIQHFKEWIVIANNSYPQIVTKKLKEEKQQKEQAVLREIELKEKTINVNDRLKQLI